MVADWLVQKLNLEKKNLKTEPGKKKFKTEPGKKIFFKKLNLEKNIYILKTEPGKKKIFFIKVFVTSKNFCNIDHTHF